MAGCTHATCPPAHIACISAECVVFEPCRRKRALPFPDRKFRLKGSTPPCGANLLRKIWAKVIRGALRPLPVLRVAAKALFILLPLSNVLLLVFAVTR